MIRKIVHIIISLLILFVSTGILVSSHYCHGQLVSVSYFQQAESCCNSETCSCCHTDTEFHQLKEDYTSSDIIDHVDYFQFSVILETLFLKSIYKADFVKFTYIFSGSPPGFDLHTLLADIQNFRL